MAITFDAVSASTALNNSDTSRTWSHTVAAGSNRVLLVGTRVRDADAQNQTYATAVTYDGVSLTKYTEYGVLSSGLGQYLGVQWWYLLNPTVGTANVVVTWGNGTPQQGGAVALSFAGVDQSTPIEASGTSDAVGSLTATATVTTTTANAWVVSNVYSGAASATLGAGPTQRDQTVYGSDFGASATTATTSTGSVTHTWTHDASELGDVIGLAISVRAAPSEVPTGTSGGLVIGSATAFVGQSFVGSIEVAGTAYTQSLSASLTPAAALVRRPGKPLAASLTASGTIARRPARVLTASLTAAGTLTKRTARAVAASLTATATLATTRVVVLALTASLTASAALTRRVSRSLAASLTPAGTLTKRLARSLAASLTATATVTKQSRRALSAALTPAGALAKRTARALSATLASTAAVSRTAQRALSATLTPAASLLTTLTSAALTGLVTAVLTLRNVVATLTQRAPEATLTARAPDADLTARAEAVAELTQRPGDATLTQRPAVDSALTARPSTDGTLRLETDDPV